MKIEFAPLNIPFTRRLQTAAVVQWVFSFLALAQCCLAVFILLCFSDYWPLAALYVGWLYLDWDTPVSGGRRCQWIRNWKVWTYFHDYFPIKLIKTEDLDPSRNYLFGFHPHGVLVAGAFGNFCTEASGFTRLFPGLTPYLLMLPFWFRVPFYRDYIMSGVHPESIHSASLLVAGAFGNFCTEASGFTRLFPGLTPYLLMLPFWFRVPFYRDYIMSGGLVSSDKRSASYLLSKKEGGNVAVVAVGGAPESLEARPGALTLQVLSRKGFIKMAISNGANLVPVFSFGENELFNQMQNPQGSMLRNIQERLQKIMGVALPLFHARGVFQYSFGLLPFRKPIFTVVGRPIPVQKNPNPSKEEIDKLHAKYLESLIQLFEEHKAQHGIEDHKHLVLI